MTSLPTQSPPLVPPDSEPPWGGRFTVLILVVVTIAAMGRLCFHDFSLWDDQGTVAQNAWLQPPTLRTLYHYWTAPVFGIYIPVTYTVWAAVAAFAHVPKDQYGIALNPWLFHGTNVFFHLLAVLVAYRILRLLNADHFASVCGALLLAVHPVQVEAVAWVSGLKDVLSGMLALVALWQYVSFSLSDMKGRASSLRYLLATTALMLAMLAKPSAMALPLAALAIDCFGIGRPWRRAIPAAIGWFAVAIPIAAIARWAQDASNTPMPALWLRPLIACDSLAFYMGKLIWPVHLSIDYGRNPGNVLSHGWCYWDWIFPAGAAAFLIAGARRRPVLLAAGLIFLAGVLPVLGFTPALYQFFSTTTDHYLYWAMFGPALALAWLLSVRPSLTLRCSTCLILAVLVALTIHQAGFWQNDIALFTHATDVNPSSYVGYTNLGGFYQRDHDTPHALAAFENATHANPDYALAWGDLADELADSGRPDDAIAAARKSVDLQTEHPNLRPSWPQDNALLGDLLFNKSQFAQAIPYLQNAADADPENRNVAQRLKTAREHLTTRPSASGPASRDREGATPTEKDAP